MSLEWAEVIPYGITLATIVYTSGKLSGSFATKDEITAVKNELHNLINAKERESVQEHKSLASKSALTKIEAAMFDDIKELRLEMAAALSKIDTQYRDMLKALLDLDRHLMTRTPKKDTPTNG